jgi:hypothetical protein
MAQGREWRKFSFELVSGFSPIDVRFHPLARRWTICHSFALPPTDRQALSSLHFIYCKEVQSHHNKIGK